MGVGIELPVVGTVVGWNDDRSVGVVVGKGVRRDVGSDVGATVGARVGAPVGGTTQLVVPFVDGTSPARHSHVYDELPSGTATQKVG